VAAEYRALPATGFQSGVEAAQQLQKYSTML
jgi:hypothetical protein